MSNLNDLFEHAVQQHQAGRLVDAIIAYRQFLSVQENQYLCHYNLALALQALGKADEAAASYQRTIALNPDFAEPHNNLGNILHLQGRLDEAKQAYYRAAAINPKLVQAQFNLGLVLEKQFFANAAVEHFQSALALAPDYFEALDHLCRLLKALGRTEDWLKAFRQFEALDKSDALIFVAGMAACRYLGDFARERQYVEALCAYQFKDDQLEMLEGLLLTAQYFDLHQEQLLGLYQAFNQLAKRRHAVAFPLVPVQRPQRDRLRIGYLSADFRRHVMGKLMFEVLSRHDRSRFELHLYSLARQEDELTTRFRGISDKYVDLHPLTAQQAARLIAEDDLDILIDLGNHTSESDPMILAYKPARVQITHLGAHGGVGLDSVDYKLTDHYADVPENQAYMIEKLLPMEGCVFPFRHVEPMKDAGFSRATLGIPEGAVVLGVFANIMKLSPRCLLTWAAILQRIEPAVLVFSPFNEDEKLSYLRQTAAAGIDPARVKFIPASKDEQFNRARYSLLDIALDTFPYSGGDTTLAALDMGVPVVTLCGQRHSERTSFSILMNLGVAQTVAYSEAEYIDLTCRLASDANWRDEVRQRIQLGLTDSPLVDMDAYTRNLEDAYLRAIAGCPAKESGENKDVMAFFQTALRQHQGNDFAGAEAGYLQVLTQEPEHVAALYLYGKLLEQLARDEDAVAQLQRAVALSPAYLDAHQALGNLYLKSGRLEDAMAHFNRALEVKSDHFPAMNGLGRALTSAGRLPQAIVTLEQAIAHQPQESVAHFNLGVAFQKSGMTDAATQAYRHACALDGNNIDPIFNMGVLCQELGQFERAAGFYREVLRIQPDSAPAYFHLGDVLFSAGKINAWLDNFQQFRRRTRASSMLAIYGLQACQYLGEVAQRQAYLDYLTGDELSGIDGTDRLEEILFLALYFDLPQRQLFALYQHYNRLSKVAGLLPLAARESGGKIRLGYLSADLRDHVMGKMMYQVISLHDKAQFEIFCYSLSQQQDGWTERFRNVSHQFVNLAGLDARTAASRIAEDSLDILVDLSTHTKGGLPSILAFKPARLQITHIASAGAAGLDSVDFKLTDRYADTAENQAYLLEQLLPMQGCVFPYRHIAPAAKHIYRRDKLGIGKQAVVLGAFVTLMKLSPRCLALWSKVLEALPQAVLAFSPLNNEAKSGYLKWLAAAGIPAKRVVFIPQGKDESQNQARFGLVDFVLDTMPYGGVNGVLEALDMGVPVITLCGERHGERTAFSILKNLGVEATIAGNEQEFVSIALRLASDGAFRNSVVKDIRRGLENSVLIDMAGHTRNLEDAYRQALMSKHILGDGEGQVGA